MCPGEGGDKAFFTNHVITGSISRESVDEIPPLKITKVIVRATELNSENIYVSQIGVGSCYKLGQICFITNYGKCC